MSDMSILNTCLQGRAKFFKAGSWCGVTTFFSDKLPESFNQIQIGGIRRKKDQIDAHKLGCISNQPTGLVGSIIENNRDRQARLALLPKLEQQFYHAPRLYIGIVAHGYHLQSHSVKGS